MIFNPQPQKQEEQKVEVTVTGMGDYENCYIDIFGQRHYGKTIMEEVPAGTRVYCYAMAETGLFGSIVINNSVVRRSPGGRAATYTFDVNERTSINLVYKQSTTNTGTIASYAEIRISYQA